jgi:hypothetical protein
MAGIDVEGSVSETTPETVPSEATPEAAPAEKAPFEPPQWLYEQTPEDPQKEAAKPTPQAEPQREWNAPTFDPDLFARDGDRYMQWFMRGFLGPLAQSQIAQEQRFKELQDRVSAPATIHPALVNDQMRRAQTGLSVALEKFSGDAAFASPVVRKRVEDYYKGFLKEARTLAKKGDFSGIDALTDEDFHDTTFEYLKRKAGFKNGKLPGSVASPETSLETPKGHAVAGDAKFSAEDEAAYKYAHETRGTSRADFAKLVKIDKDQRGE